MKRIYIFLLALCCLFFAGCGDQTVRFPDLPTNDSWSASQPSGSTSKALSEEEPAPDFSPQETSLQAPTVTEGGRRIVTFGAYEQDGNLSNGPEPIEWLVIAEQSGRELLLSRYVLDVHVYNYYNEDISWEDCALRAWLNGAFLENTFSADGRNAIIPVTNLNLTNSTWETVGGNSTVDSVFCLSIEETVDYLGAYHTYSGWFYDDRDGSDELYAESTPFAGLRGGLPDSDGFCFIDDDGDSWWLRDAMTGYHHGSTHRYESADVFEASIGSGTYVNRKCGVRPALWRSTSYSGTGIPTEYDSSFWELDETVTDLHLALICSAVYDTKNIEKTVRYGTDDYHYSKPYIDHKYSDTMPDRELMAKLSNYDLIEIKSSGTTGFRAEAFRKGDNIVIAYCGTEEWTADGLADLTSGLIDYSWQDDDAKAFAQFIAEKYPDCRLYITGHSLGGRLAYLGAEALCDLGYGERLERICTFNGLGVKEAVDLENTHLSNVYGLEQKFGAKCVNHIVRGDPVSDPNLLLNLMGVIGYVHVGKEDFYECSNPFDDGINWQHDLYTFMDALSQ